MYALEWVILLYKISGRYVTAILLPFTLNRINILVLEYEKFWYDKIIIKFLSCMVSQVKGHK